MRQRYKWFSERVIYCGVLAKEIEIAYYGINREDTVSQLHKLGAKFIGKYLMRRINFQLANRGKLGTQSYYTSWIRIREKGKIATLALKEQEGNKITGRKEFEVEVSDFDTSAKIIYKALKKPVFDYFENYREEYSLSGTVITIDKFPNLPYIMEIEGKTKASIDSLLKKMEIKGKLDKNKSVPTDEYYALHGYDYKKVQKRYKHKIEMLLKE